MNLEIAPPTGFGMHYQWGRKDPFTPTTHTDYAAHDNAKEVQLYEANGEAITGSSNGIGGEFTYEDRSLLTTITPTTINDLIENPSTYYNKGDETNQVPIASTGDLKNDWWNPITKTIYDPCPNGYRIPKKNTYGNAVDNANDPTGWLAFSVDGLQSGRIWDIASSFFPANGYRYSSSGKFSAVCSGGYSWMSTPQSSIRGHNLDFYYSAVIPNRLNGRSYGYPVRCILE